MELAKQQCSACRPDSPAVPATEQKELLRGLPGWDIRTRSDIPRLVKTYVFKDFRTALVFTNRVGQLAEDANHHPELLTEWGRVRIAWWTHSIKGLHRNDFILAARCETLID